MDNLEKVADIIRMMDDKILDLKQSNHEKQAKIQRLLKENGDKINEIERCHDLIAKHNRTIKMLRVQLSLLQPPMP